ncbi:MAG: response regulator, partial [Iodobacter sp.]
NHGQEALELLAARDAAYFDVILMDMQMPVMDGYEASRRIRAQACYDRVPLIAMTAHAMVEERARCLALGMNDHISKPIDPLQFFACLKNWKNAAVVHVPDTVKTVVPAPVAGQELDIQVGLGYVLNNSSLYLRMLKQFCSSEADCVQRTHQALLANDLEPALRYAHTLKGLTATLGATPLSVLAGRVELAISKGGGLAEVKDDLLQLEQRLAVLIREVQDYIHSEDPGAPAPSGKMAEKELLELLAWLERLLLDMDAEALTVLGQYGHAMAVYFDPADFAAFRSALEKFNFGDALPILQKMSKAVQ